MNRFLVGSTEYTPRYGVSSTHNEGNKPVAGVQHSGDPVSKLTEAEQRHAVVLATDSEEQGGVEHHVQLRPYSNTAVRQRGHQRAEALVSGELAGLLEGAAAHQQQEAQPQGQGQRPHSARVEEATGLRSQ